jgi:DNA-binding Lrp family transcriptional regulator
MRQRFFIFVKCDPGKAYEVGMAIIRRKLEYVADVSSISGKWDLLLRVELDDRRDVARTIIEPLIEIGHIKRTKTLFAYDVYDPADVFFADD